VHVALLAHARLTLSRCWGSFRLPPAVRYRRCLRTTCGLFSSVLRTLPAHSPVQPFRGHCLHSVSCHWRGEKTLCRFERYCNTTAAMTHTVANLRGYLRFIFIAVLFALPLVPVDCCPCGRVPLLPACLVRFFSAVPAAVFSRILALTAIRGTACCLYCHPVRLLLPCAAFFFAHSLLPARTSGAQATGSSKPTTASALSRKFGRWLLPRKHSPRLSAYRAFYLPCLYICPYLPTYALMQTCSFILLVFPRWFFLFWFCCCFPLLPCIFLSFHCTAGYGFAVRQRRSLSSCAALRATRMPLRRRARARACANCCANTTRFAYTKTLRTAVSP